VLGHLPGGRVDWLAESIVYVCSLIGDRPRAIDRYIDYFGEGASASLFFVTRRIPAARHRRSGSRWDASW